MGGSQTGTAPQRGGPRSIRDLWDLPSDIRHRALCRVAPEPFLRHYGLSLPDRWSEEPAGTFRCLDVPGENAVRIEIWPDVNCEDPGLVLELTDTYLGHLEASWIVINDIHGPRFHVDRDPKGNPAPLGSPVRNLREEIRALAAGLAPNQVRPGLRMFRHLIANVEAFCRFLGVEILYVAPLAYHNAIKYEQYGFTYASGQEDMEWIHRQFLPGGALRARMDGSRPFRMPWMADTIRGRSWAIHDGVLGRRWMAPQMYKFVGRDFSTRTFPNAVW